MKKIKKVCRRSQNGEVDKNWC